MAPTGFAATRESVVSEPCSGRFPGLGSGLTRLLWWWSGSLLLISLSGRLGRWWWVADLTAHFPVQYLIATAAAWVVCGCVWWWSKARLGWVVAILTFGIALYSRLPWDDCGTFELEEGLAALEVVLPVAGRPWRLLGVHVLPPVSGAASARRNRQLGRIAARVARARTPAVVLGDLNCTSWSPHFRDLQTRGRLQDSRRGRGVQPTWPVGVWPLSIPIDHCLVTEGIRVVRREVTARVGSDHRGVLVEMVPGQ